MYLLSFNSTECCIQDARDYTGGWMMLISGKRATGLILLCVKDSYGERQLKFPQFLMDATVSIPGIIIRYLL